MRVGLFRERGTVRQRFHTGGVPIQNPPRKKQDRLRQRRIRANYETGLLGGTRVTVLMDVRCYTYTYVPVGPRIINAFSRGRQVVSNRLLYQLHSLQT